MKTKLSTLVLIFWTINSFSQIAHYDISTYVRPDLIRKTLSLKPNFSFANSLRKGENTDLSRFNFNTGFSLYQTVFINTVQEQKSISNRGSFESSFSNQKDVIDNQTIFNPSLGRSYSRKKFKADQKFWEIDYNTNFYYGRRHKKLANQLDKTKEHYLSTELGLSIYRGKGRIEWVTDAWQATTIFETLADYGLLTKVVSKEQIQDFAAVISNIKNTRQTDGRLEEISEYSQLCTYLVESDLVNTNDYSFFAVLRDTWIYEAFINRRSGDELKVGFSPNTQLRTRSFPNFSRNPDYYSTTNLDIVLAYNRYQALSLDWQFDNTNKFSSGLSFFKNLTNPTSSNASAVHLINRFDSYWSWHYIPNQRTNYSCSIDFSSGFHQSLKKDALDNFRYFFDVGLRGGYQYYVSPQLTWDLRAYIRLYTFSDELAIPNAFENDSNLSFNVSYWFY